MPQHACTAAHPDNTGKVSPGQTSLRFSAAPPGAGSVDPIAGASPDVSGAEKSAVWVSHQHDQAGYNGRGSDVHGNSAGVITGCRQPMSEPPTLPLTGD